MERGDLKYVKISSAMNDRVAFTSGFDVPIPGASLDPLAVKTLAKFRS